MPSFLLCMHPAARIAILVLLGIAILLLVIRLVLRGRISWIPIVVAGILILLAVWLGSYRISPLGFTTGRIPLVSGFWVTRTERARIWAAPFDVMTMAEGSAIGIQSVLLPGPASCMWSSSNGGSFEDPTGCDTAYEPGPGAAYDVLRVNVRSACGLPSTVAEIRISVLP